MQMKNNFFRGLKGAFAVKKAPFPWIRAICAGICSSTPIVIGLLLGNFQYGLLAGIGGFAYLYVWNEPFPQRAKKIFFVALGLSAAIGLGILTASSPIIFAILIGLIGGIGTFIFGALKIPGPASIFFVIVFAMTSASQPDPSLASTYAGLVFLGGVFAWCVAMLGWFFNPQGPETNAVKRVYLELASLSHSVETDQFNAARERVVIALKDADATLIAGYASWNSSIIYKRLYLLKDQASFIFSDILEMVAEGRKQLPPELGQTVEALAHSLHSKKNMETPVILQPEETDKAVDRLFSKIYDADAILNEPLTKINQKITISKPTLHSVFSDAFDKNSIVFISALKYGVVLMIAALIAFAFDFDRSYWIPVSCGATMLGSTIMSTFQRGIQRSIGTIVGVLIVTIVLSFGPTDAWVALCILVFSFFTELFMVRNYAFAVMFITPSSLLIAENTTQIHNLSYFATARITDIIIGVLIGLAGVLLIGRRSASSRLPHLIAKTIRSQSQLFFMLFSEQNSEVNVDKSKALNKLRTNLVNLRTIYTTALGEVPTNKEVLELLWPAIFSIEQLGYVLEFGSNHANRPVLSDGMLAQFLLVFETMAKTVELQHHEKNKHVPIIEGYSKIQQEIISLQNALQLFHNQTRLT
ncbi:FUSC family protein [Psychrobacillus soli]|uniref:FUSC family protein n=2 Tax=Psychrobacillus soli TaxID=1543965 RepID=A0A544T2J0_9BACI|nr:FUSC family protein [Psychrobacillus soli]